MFRVLLGASRLISGQLLRTAVPTVQRLNPTINPGVRSLSIIAPRAPTPLLAQPPSLLQNIICRGLIKFSYKKGKRKSCSAAVRRFYRLDWGGWIRTKCGRKKKLWKKSAARRRRLRQHVLCNSTQSTLLDKLVGPYWTKRRYYVDDPYEPYHVRPEFHLAAKTPKPYFPPEK